MAERDLAWCCCCRQCVEVKSNKVAKVVKTKVSSFIRGLDRRTDLNPKVERPSKGVHHDAGAVRDLHEPIGQLSIQSILP
jgi:hypothetical protein